MINQIKQFWIESYRSDKLSFYFELLSFFFTVIASMTLAITALSPDMRFIYPSFFLGSVFGFIGYVRRKLAWPSTLMIYFAIINVFGFGISMSWW